MSIIIGIDPGLHTTGYGVIKKQKHDIYYLDSGCIKSKSRIIYERLKFIYKFINKIILKFNPNYIAIEKVFVSKYAHSSLKLCQCFGVIVLAVSKFNLPIFEYSTRYVKQKVVGTGLAKKSQIKITVSKLLKIDSFLEEDEADALAVALTYYYTNRNKLSNSE